MTQLSAPEQLLLELINRARMDPNAEAARYGIDLNHLLPPGTTISPTSKQVLAGNDILARVAEAHTGAVISSNAFATGKNPHLEAGDGTPWTTYNPNGTKTLGRIEAAGYHYSYAAENI